MSMDEKAKILDIAMNLNRVGNWCADNYLLKQKRIIIFIDQTSNYLKSINPSSYPEPLKRAVNQFLKLYPALERAGRTGPPDELLWAETMMTWGNILTHRAQLL